MLTVKIKNQQQECMFTDCFVKIKSTTGMYVHRLLPSE